MKAELKPIVVLIFVCAAMVSCKKAEPTRTLALRIDSLVSRVPDFSGVVMVAHQGKPIYHKAFGYRNFLTREPNDTTSVFELASVSKQFTAAAIMLLQQEGKLQYDDSLHQYISELPYDGITIRHLLNHTSGLPDYQSIMDAHWDKSKVAGNEDNIACLKQYHPEKLFEPGEQYAYSNTGYMLLASIAEQASGEDFIQYCNRKIFEPLQMTSTAIRTRDEKNSLPHMAWGNLWVEDKHEYVSADSFPEFNYTIWLGNRKGPGRVSSTAADLLKWDQALYSHALFTEAALSEAFKPARLNSGALSMYGFGWEIEQHATLGKVVRHSGDNPGYKTQIVRYINANKTIILLSNNAHAQFEELLKGLEELVAD